MSKVSYVLPSKMKKQKVRTSSFLLFTDIYIQQPLIKEGASQKVLAERLDIAHRHLEFRLEKIREVNIGKGPSMTQVTEDAEKVKSVKSRI